MARICAQLFALLLFSALVLLGQVYLSVPIHNSTRASTASYQGQRYEPSDLGNISSQDLAEFEVLSTKSSYDPLNHPLLSKVSKLKVLFLSEERNSPSGKHLFLDGIQQSEYLDLVAHVELMSNSSYSMEWGEDVWIYDLKSNNCASPNLIRYVQTAVKHRKEKQNREETSPGNSILFLHVDYTDIPRLDPCSNLESLIGGNATIQFARRCIVEGRQYNLGKEWIDLGHYAENKRGVLHSPYPVRTDLVHDLRNILLKQNIPSPIDFAPKLWDVAYFWSKSNDDMAHFRNRITDICLNLTESTLPKSGTKLRTWCTMAGKAGAIGRGGVQEEYLLQLLRSRIVIVVQRDDWEDHYRLMEALASGAMVVADFMLSLPKGLAHGKSIVLFRSEQELREAVLYYADHEEERQQIARNGWEVAMGRHRSWHRLEELLFGHPLTNVENPYGAFEGNE